MLIHFINIFFHKIIFYVEEKEHWFVVVDKTLYLRKKIYVRNFKFPLDVIFKCKILQI